MRSMVSEVYQGPAATDAAKLLQGLGVALGVALHLAAVNVTCLPSGFDNDERRAEAGELIDEQRTAPRCRLRFLLCMR